MRPQSTLQERVRTCLKKIRQHANVYDKGAVDISVSPKFGLKGVLDDMRTLKVDRPAARRMIQHGIDASPMKTDKR